MQFGVQFFPSVSPDEKSAAAYFAESLPIAEESEALGFTHARTVEHYFERYGGYSPNPIVFLSALSQRTKVMRLVTGAVLPIFNHPLKLAGELGMLDAISDGRLDIGFARAFLPHEFRHFGVSLNESRARFDEGVEQVRRLLEEENVTSEGRFHSFRNVTSLPRPTQRPRPPIYVAAQASRESFERAGANGYNIMAIPLAGGAMKELIDAYRASRAAAGHAEAGTVMLAFHMLCHENQAEAERLAREPINRYLRSLVDAASDWTSGARSDDYPGYDKIIAGLARETFETLVEKSAAWVGTPERILETIAAYQAQIGSF